MPKIKLTEGDRRGGGTSLVQPNGSRIGNPPHERSAAIAHKAETLAALGNRQEAIALACDISVDTLARHYGAELQQGLARANHRVGVAILQTADGERVDCVDCDEDRPGKTLEGKRCKTCHGTGWVWRREPNTTAQIWWSKNRMGWTDRERIEHVGDGGGPVITEQRSSGDTIKARLEAIRKRTSPANDPAD